MRRIHLNTLKNFYLFIKIQDFNIFISQTHIHATKHENIVNCLPHGHVFCWKISLKISDAQVTHVVLIWNQICEIENLFDKWKKNTLENSPLLILLIPYSLGNNSLWCRLNRWIDSSSLFNEETFLPRKHIFWHAKTKLYP